MLRRLKLTAVSLAEKTGVSGAMLDSAWRRNRLLILCYHGTSLEDEHEWDSQLYMPRTVLRERLNLIKEYDCSVLPLDDAVRRLYDGSLPERSVAITVDDGSYDFYKVAWPIFREYGYPVTVYLTTYYSDYNRPVFDVMCSYLLWKGRGQRLDWPEVLSEPATLDDGGRSRTDREIKAFALKTHMSARDKDSLLGSLAARLAIDYEEICRKRLLHIMTPGEARELAEAGVDIQLHTHRHRVYRHQHLVVRELDDNRNRIARISAVVPRHFCYPGGFYLPEFATWFREYGLLSATTCRTGLASRRSDPMLLPRLVDTTTLTAAEFRSWITGFGSLLPARRHVMSEGQLIEDTTDMPVSQLGTTKLDQS